MPNIQPTHGASSFEDCLFELKWRRLKSKLVKSILSLRVVLDAIPLFI